MVLWLHGIYLEL